MNMAGSTLTARDQERKVTLTVQVWKEAATHIAYAPELDISSCGKTASQAKSRLREAISLFIEEAERMGTLSDILEEAGFERQGNNYRPRRILTREKMQLTLPAA
jgi:predicted RNase H-like HicB family nuclease